MTKKSYTPEDRFPLYVRYMNDLQFVVYKLEDALKEYKSHISHVKEFPRDVVMSWLFDDTPNIYLDNDIEMIKKQVNFIAPFIKFALKGEKHGKQDF